MMTTVPTAAAADAAGGDRSLACPAAVPAPAVAIARPVPPSPPLNHISPLFLDFTERLNRGQDGIAGAGAAGSGAAAAAAAGLLLDLLALAHPAVLH